MPEDATVNVLTDAAMARNERVISILTTFFQEASVLVFVFGILDTYANDKLNSEVGIVVASLGTALLIGAFAVKSVFYRLSKRSVRSWLTLHEQAAAGGKK